MRKNQDEVKFEISGVSILMQIKSPFIRDRVREHYGEFISQNNPDILIEVKHRGFEKPRFEDLLFETRSWKLGRQDGSLFLYFPGKNRDSLARFNDGFNHIKFYTKDSSGQLLLYLFPELLFSLTLPRHEALMLHACGILDKNKGYLFIAPAEGGKSTIAKLALKKELTVLNDDRIILRKIRNKHIAFGNPWHGEVENTSNNSSNVGEVFFLKKSKSNQIKPMRKSDMAVELYKNSFHIPIDNDMIKDVFSICFDLAENLNCYYFYFKPDKSIWKCLDEAFK